MAINPQHLPEYQVSTSNRIRELEQDLHTLLQSLDLGHEESARRIILDMFYSLDQLKQSI